MSYRIEYDPAPTFLRATVTGTNSAAAVQAYMREILAECQRQQCHRVLIDEQLDGPRLGVDAVFEIASEGAIEALGFFQAVAYVDEAMGEMAHFAETVALNRGMPVRAFPTIAEAERWLIEQTEGPQESAIFEPRDN